MPLSDKRLNRILVILSIVVTLSSIGVFTWLSTAFNKAKGILESVDKIEALEQRLKEDHQIYLNLIKEYKGKLKEDSLEHKRFIKKIKEFEKYRVEDSIKTDYNYQWVIYWQND